MTDKTRQNLKDVRAEAASFYRFTIIDAIDQLLIADARERQELRGKALERAALKLLKDLEKQL